MRRFLALAFLVSLLVLAGCGRDTVLGFLTDPLPPPYANPEPGDYDGGFTFGFNPPQYDYHHDENNRLIIYYTENPALSFVDRAAWNVFDYENWAASSIPVNGPRTFRAFCYIDETTFSEVRTYNYVFRPQTPYTEPSTPPGAYTTATNINIYSPSGDPIYYTLDGSDPSFSATPWTGPLLLDEGNPALHIRAVARPSTAGWIDSEELNVFYTFITPQALQMGITIRLPGNVNVGLTGTPVTITQADSITVTSNPTGSFPGPISYAWFLNGTVVPGAVVNELSLGPGLAVGTYQLSCRLTDNLGNEYSAPFFFIVLPAPSPPPDPSETGLAVTVSLPTGQNLDANGITTIYQNDSHTFSATFSPTTSFVADWYLDGQLVVDGTLPGTVSQYTIGPLGNILDLRSHGLSCSATVGEYQYSWTSTFTVTPP